MSHVDQILCNDTILSIRRNLRWHQFDAGGSLEVHR
jgi:hypothetical protein